MSVDAASSPTNEEAIFAAGRSRAYLLFAMAVDFPDEEMRRLLSNGELMGALREVLAPIAPELEPETKWDVLGDVPDADALAIEHTRLFEVGTSGPPCPLYGGLYHGARMKTMEETVRFYEHFGLGLSEEPRELPDHLTTQLEFVHFLAFREAEALESGDDAGPWRRAGRDFVARHPGRWVPKLLSRLAGASPDPWHAALFDLLSRWLALDLRHLERVAGPPTRDDRA